MHNNNRPNYNNSYNLMKGCKDCYHYKDDSERIALMEYLIEKAGASIGFRLYMLDNQIRMKNHCLPNHHLHSFVLFLSKPELSQTLKQVSFS